MSLRSHRAPCIFWSPISYYFFGFGLLSFCSLQVEIQPYWPVVPLPLTVPQTLLSRSFLETGMALFSAITISLPSLIDLFLISLKFFLKCHLLNEALSKLSHTQPSLWNSLSPAIYFFPYNISPFTTEKILF